MSNTITSLPLASTIDPALDWIAIDTTSLTSTQRINRNTYLNLGSAPVGLTDSQTLTNKTLTSPTISGATLSGTISGTYTIGGTPTFPSSVVQLTSTQTLTNKTLTSPTINSPTITNATLSADTITGFTTSTSGTIYGVSITGGNTISTAMTFSSLLTGSSGLTISGGITQLLPTLKNPYKFSVYRNAAWTQNISPLIFDTKLFDTGTNYSTSTGLFTAPISGFYYFSAAVAVPHASGIGFSVGLNKNGSTVKNGISVIVSASNAFNMICTVGGLLQLAASDTVSIYQNGQAATGGYTGSTNTYFDGFLVSAS